MAKKLGVGKKMPTSEAKPLGTNKRGLPTGVSKTRRNKAGAGSTLSTEPVTVHVEPDVLVTAENPVAADTSVESADTTEKNPPSTEILLDSPPSPVVTSSQPAIMPNTENVNSRSRTVQLSLDKISKSGTTAIYKGAAVAIRIGLSAFPNKTAPTNLDLVGELAPPKTARVPETKEERKARLAALPKLTPAERVARLEAKLAKAKAKLEAPAAEQAPAAAEPQPEPATV